MTRPKTYGEFADANEYTRVDERLRDRVIYGIQKHHSQCSSMK